MKRSGLMGYLVLFLLGNGYYLYEAIEHEEPISLLLVSAAALLLGAGSILFSALERAGSPALLFKVAPVVILAGYGYVYFDLYEHGDLTMVAFVGVLAVLVLPAVYLSYRLGFGGSGSHRVRKSA